MRCVQHLLQKFGNAKLEGVPREENGNAGALAKMGSQMESVLLGQTPLEIKEIPSIPEINVFQVQEVPQETWMTPIHNYSRTGTLPEDKLQARRLYLEEGLYILREEYEGICGNHSGGGSLALKVLRQGYYWPSMKEDAFKFFRACDHC
ncbi:uncharacterized protein LOC141691195 [Apium graveolens]|uniref:uncharacterized protein LOC141691195 n=1 Tax=Apium graveolens TaxID=4045 RepID=UPI003D7960FE